MTTLVEIETAADALPAIEKQELLLYLAARLRSQPSGMPELRKFSREQMAAWVSEDEADLIRLRQNP